MAVAKGYGKGDRGRSGDGDGTGAVLEVFCFEPSRCLSFVFFVLVPLSDKDASTSTLHTRFQA